MNMPERPVDKSAVVCVVGAGYVGLPLAEAFSKHLKVTGYDVNEKKVGELNKTNNTNLKFTSDPAEIKRADFILITVPTPITRSKEPDLSYVKSAAETVGQNLKKGSCRGPGVHGVPGGDRGNPHPSTGGKIRDEMRSGLQDRLLP